MNKQSRKPMSAGRMIWTVIRTFFGTLGRLIATMIMVGIITGCIVASVLTVYILDYIGADEEIDLDSYRLGYTSIIYAYDKNGDEFELQQLYFPDGNRIWVSYDEISEYVKLAVVAVEDKRFWEHDGVDWRRTFGAFANMFMPGVSTGGGSTITQQLIKNLTEDDDLRVDRKVREIFRALNVAKRYSREQILESYLNVVPFGNGTNGIESAANRYFGKSASDLTLAEAASIVGITQYPTYYNPFINPDNNRDRQLHILKEMLEQEKITQAEHDEAVAQELDFRVEEYQQSAQTIQNYFVDHVIESVVNDLVDQRGYTRTYATEQLYGAGYRIYATVDMEIQEFLEDFYLTEEKFPAVYNEDYPQSAAVILDPYGKMVAVVGGIGNKTGDRVFNRATMATRHPGSALKPIGPYALAFEYNQVTWSTLVEDSPINIAQEGQPAHMWPTNFYNDYLGNVTIAYAIQQSVNTVPAKLVRTLSARTVFDFLQNQLNFYNLVDGVVIDGQVYSDADLAPMTLGALTYGVTPVEMAGGFQIYANGGSFTTPYAYYRVEDSEGRTVLEPNTTRRQVISQDTSIVMNRALQNVVTNGTGTTANLGTLMPTAGKTGTSDDDVNQWFLGMTPHYVCAVWLGYDEEQRQNEYGNWVPNKIGYYSYPPPILWKSLMEPIHQDLDYIQFPESDQVVQKAYCTITGNLATTGCTSVAMGWYKASHLPPNCTGHATVDENRRPGVGDGEEDDSGDNDTDATPVDDDAPVSDLARWYADQMDQ